MDVNEIIKAKKNRQLSDNEIVKTLICCQECNCKDCPKYISELGRCMGTLDSDEILGLIQRQKAQIEELSDKHWGECRQIAHYSDEEANEKQTPMKPEIYGDGCDDKGGIIFDSYDCPTCRTSYELDYDKYDYCPSCGQKFDWSDTE